MSPLIPLVAGVLALLAGSLLQRTFGARHRVGRLLASTPLVTIAEARELAGGRPRYVRVEGRIDADTEFEDAAHRPLVFRRTRLQSRHGSTWIDVEDRRERVPFELREGLDSIIVEDRDLDAGLVVVVRESVGTAADAVEGIPAGTDPATPVRLRIEQISSIEHAIAAGVPVRNGDGSVRLAAGLGRPLILTTLDRSDAMRALTEGDSRGAILVAVLLVSGLVLLAIGLAWTLLEVVA